MNQSASSEVAKAVVRRNTEEVQSKGNFELFEELFADDFIDHTPQPGTTPDKDGVRVLYHRLREGFPDFRADIQWQVADDNLVTTYKIYHGRRPAHFSESRPRARQSSSRQSTSCESSTAGSPSTGASRVS